MKKTTLMLIALLTTLLFSEEEMKQSFYDFNATTITGKTISMSKYKSKVVLVVNVASKCGFTPQYEGLQKLYDEYNDKGLEILGFPCNQFREQEPASNKEIKNFCTVNFGIKFPMFAKIDVNGDNATPLYKYLKKEATGFMWTERIKWNFTKFLINRDGKVITRYAPITKPADIAKDIERLLK